MGGRYYHSPLINDSIIVGVVYSPTASCGVYCCYTTVASHARRRGKWYDQQTRRMNLWLIVVCCINYIGAECLHKMSDTHDKRCTFDDL